MHRCPVITYGTNGHGSYQTEVVENSSAEIDGLSHTLNGDLGVQVHACFNVRGLHATVKGSATTASSRMAGDVRYGSFSHSL